MFAPDSGSVGKPGSAACSWYVAFATFQVLTRDQLY